MNEPVAASTPPLLQGVRTGALLMLVTLVAWGLAWELWLAPTGRGTLAIKVLPLAAALPGVARHRLYTYRWLSLLVWLYVGEGLVRVMSDSGLGTVLAAGEIAIGLLIFGLCVRYIRGRQRQR